MYSLLFSFRGRVNRALFWLIAIGLGIAEAVVLGITFGGVVLAVANPESARPPVGALPMIFAVLLCAVFSWIHLAVSVKRCHDRNRSGWFMLVAALPILNVWYLIEVGFLPGTRGSNEYGPDPLGTR